MRTLQSDMEDANAELGEMRTRGLSLEHDRELAEDERDELRYDLDLERERLVIADAKSLSLCEAIKNVRRGVLALEELYELAEQQVLAPC